MLPFLIDNDRMMNLLYLRIKEYFPNVDSNILRKWYLFRRTDTLRPILKKYYNHEIYKYTGDLIQILKDRSVVIYGAGMFGEILIEELSKYESISIRSWVDREADRIKQKYRKVEKPDTLNVIEFDLIVIAILDEGKAKFIAQDISKRYSIPEEKIIWKYSRKIGII